MTTKICIIAGVGPGVGLAVAKRFAREGFSLALLARRAEALSAYAHELSALGVDARGYPADLSDGASTQNALAAAARDLGAASVLVYNASLWREADPMRLDPKLFTSDLQLSATGALICAQAVYPDMVKAGEGTMLFTGGGLALKPEYGAPVISLTAGKSALRGLTHAMAPTLAKDNIHLATVTIAGNVAPGTAFDPDRIAEQFWRLHQQPRDAWETEAIFTGA